MTSASELIDARIEELGDWRGEMLARIRALVKRAEAARIGHVQFFDREAIHRLASGAGLRILGELSDPLPRAHHAFFARTRGARGAAAVKAAVRWGAWRVAPGAAERLFTMHYAAIAFRA